MTSKIFQLIDFDRTLFDTTQLIEALLQTIEQDDPELSAALRKESDEAYKEERTFLLLRYLREQKGDTWLETVVKDIVSRRGAKAFLLPGALERLDAANELSSARPAWGIFTYGDPIDQMMKIRLADLDAAPRHIVTSAEKGGIIASWQTKDGTFQLPPEFGGAVVDTLTFEDDKLQVFNEIPDSVIGVWVTHHEDAQKRLAETGLQNVTIARDLSESLQQLRHRIHKP